MSLKTYIYVDNHFIGVQIKKGRISMENIKPRCYRCGKYLGMDESYSIRISLLDDKVKNTMSQNVDLCSDCLVSIGKNPDYNKTVVDQIQTQKKRIATSSMLHI